MKVNGPAADSVVTLEAYLDNGLPDEIPEPDPEKRGKAVLAWLPLDTVTGPNWAASAMHQSAQQVRPFVNSLGTGAPPLAVTITW